MFKTTFLVRKALAAISRNQVYLIAKGEDYLVTNSLKILVSYNYSNLLDVICVYRYVLASDDTINLERDRNNVSH